MAVYRFIAEEKATPECLWTISEMCRTLEVSRSGFYDWQGRAPCARDVDDATLATEIEAIWETSGRTYGSPRVHRWLRKQGFRVARKRVARIMRINGWVGESARKGYKTTTPDATAAPAPDLVAGDFNPPAPNVTWAGDITYVRTWEGWLFCAVVLDLYSRRVIGWALADHLRASLVGDALEMAIATRSGQDVTGVVFHSDRGCQYTSREFAELCEQHHVVQSMGATGICWDNAAAESFFATLKRELVHRHAWATRTHAKRAIVRWIEGWYNPRRLHSAIDYLAPNEKENEWHTADHRAA
jgi:transposase InsO family protein